MRRPLIGLFVAGLLLPGCDTQECKELRLEVEARKNSLRSARSQAAVYEATRKRALAAEGNANKLMGALGVDRPESKIYAELLERVKKIPTATIAREVVQLPMTGQAGEIPESVTQWAIRFESKDAHAAFDITATLLQTPPMLRFASLIREEKSKNKWRVELRRATIDQVQIDPQKQPLKLGRDIGDIQSNFGFCGASEMRAEIEKWDAEIAQLRDHAEGLTVELPKAASWEGLRRRAEQMRDEEGETRDHLALFEEALKKSGATLKAVGMEASMSVLEIWGTAADRNKVEAALNERGLGSRIQPKKDSAKGVERILVRNATVDRRLRPQEAGPKLPPLPKEAEKGHPGHEHE